MAPKSLTAMATCRARCTPSYSPWLTMSRLALAPPSMVSVLRRRTRSSGSPASTWTPGLGVHGGGRALGDLDDLLDHGARDRLLLVPTDTAARPRQGFEIHAVSPDPHQASWPGLVAMLRANRRGATRGVRSVRQRQIHSRRDGRPARSRIHEGRGAAGAAAGGPGASIARTLVVSDEDGSRATTDPRSTVSGSHPAPCGR